MVPPVADMEEDKVAHKVADMVADIEVDMAVNMVAGINIDMESYLVREMVMGGWLIGPKLC